MYLLAYLIANMNTRQPKGDHFVLNKTKLSYKQKCVLLRLITQ